MTITISTSTTTTTTSTRTTTLWGWEAWFVVQIAEGRYRNGKVTFIEEEEELYLLMFQDGLSPPTKLYKKTDLMEMLYTEQHNTHCPGLAAGQPGSLPGVPPCQTGQSWAEVRAIAEDFCSAEPACVGYSM